MPGNPRAGYVVVTLDLPGDAGFVDFLVDSGATTAIVSPRLREMLGASATDGAAIRGLGAMGETVRQKVTIDGVGVGSVRIGALDAVVTDLDASGLPAVVGGLLGLEFLSKARSVLIRTGSHTTAFAW
jgi:predicted aspartyl protease